METIDGWGIFVALAIVLFAVSQLDLAVTWILEKTLEPGVRWFQRVFLGIDKVRVGSEALIGCSAAAVEFHKAEEGHYVGSVRVEGETWRASANCLIPEGARVQVLSREGLTLLVEQAKEL